MNLLSVEGRPLRGNLNQKYKLEQGIETVTWHYPLAVGPSTGKHRCRTQREISTVAHCDAIFKGIAQRSYGATKKCRQCAIDQQFQLDLYHHYEAPEKSKYR